MAVKGSLQLYNAHCATSGKFVGVDLVEPSVDYRSIGQGFGVPVWRASVPAELPEQINQFLTHEGPAVLEVVLDPSDMEKRI